MNNNFEQCKYDLYECLGVSQAASQAEISNAYKILSRRYHPDLNPGNQNAKKKFTEITTAYEILSNSRTRAKYDEYRHSISNNHFTSNNSQNNSPYNTSQDLSITSKEALQGTKKIIKITAYDICPQCNGKSFTQNTNAHQCPQCKGNGQVIIQRQSLHNLSQKKQLCPNCHGLGHLTVNTCNRCNNTGVISTMKKIEVVVPAGIYNGQFIRLSGLGKPNLTSNSKGDLLLKVTINHHKFF